MTGLWQVNGRSDLSWEESVRLDLRYVENWSLTLDLQILWKTWSAVARGSGSLLMTIRDDHALAAPTWPPRRAERPACSSRRREGFDDPAALRGRR